MIKKITEKINDNDLDYITKSTDIKTMILYKYLIKKDDTLTFFNKTKRDEITIEEAKELQKNFMKRKGNKTQEQEKTVKKSEYPF